MKRPIKTMSKVYDVNGIKKEKETVTIGELKKIKESIVDGGVDLSKPSVLNKKFSKEKVLDIIFGILKDKSKDDNSLVHYMTFENVLREFVLEKKRITEEWKEKKVVKK